MGFLKSKFNVAVLGLTLCFGGAAVQPWLTDWDERHALTEGEKGFARRIFADQINTTGVKKIFRHDYKTGESGLNVAASVSNGTEIEFHGPSNHARDYSADDRNHILPLFAHELTHIWSFQHNYSQTNGKCRGGREKYEYVLLPGDRFSDFCDEKQGAMMEDYVRYYLRRVAEVPRYRIHHSESDNLLRIVVEDQFPAARAYRLEQEKQQKIRPSMMPYIPPAPIPSHAPDLSFLFR